MVPVAPPNQKERKEEQFAPPKQQTTKKKRFEITKTKVHVENFSLLSLSKYVLGFRKKYPKQQNDIKFYETTRVKFKNSSSSRLRLSSFVVLLLNIF